MGGKHFTDMRRVVKAIELGQRLGRGSRIGVHTNPVHERVGKDSGLAHAVLALAVQASGRAVGAIGAGSCVSPISHASTPAAHDRPSAIAQTIRLWPRPISPQAKTPRLLVITLASRATLARGSNLAPGCSSKQGGSGAKKPIASSTKSHGS